MTKKHLILVALICALALSMTGCMPSRTVPTPTPIPTVLAPVQTPVPEVTTVPEATTVPAATTVPGVVGETPAP